MAEYDLVKGQTDDGREKLERLRTDEVIPLQEKLSSEWEEFGEPRLDWKNFVVLTQSGQTTQAVCVEPS